MPLSGFEVMDFLELELEPRRELRLPRIAYALADESVEVEGKGRTRRDHIVLVVE